MNSEGWPVYSQRNASCLAHIMLLLATAANGKFQEQSSHKTESWGKEILESFIEVYTIFK